MKTLLILRHAKSSWKDPGLPDHERPLKKRGRQDAPRIGRLLAELDLLPEAIVSSTARRARQTAELLAEAAGFEGEIEFARELYDATVDACRAVLRGLPDDPECVLLVGHNPTFEQLLAVLTGVDERLPTAALAQVALEIDRWSELGLGVRGKLVGLWRPKELA